MARSLQVMQPPKVHSDLVPAFVTLLALGGQIGLPILVLTCLRSKRLNRHSTFVNCCISSIVYSLVFCILLSLPFPLFATFRSDCRSIQLQLLQLNGELDYIESIQGNIAARSPIMLSVSHRQLWSWPFFRCAFYLNPRSSRKKTDSDASVLGCPSLSSRSCSRYDSQF